MTTIGGGVGLGAAAGEGDCVESVGDDLVEGGEEAEGAAPDGEGEGDGTWPEVRAKSAARTATARPALCNLRFGVPDRRGEQRFVADAWEEDRD